jgi:hypothetical protein
LRRLLADALGEARQAVACLEAAGALAAGPGDADGFLALADATWEAVGCLTDAHMFAGHAGKLIDGTP